MESKSPRTAPWRPLASISPLAKSFVSRQDVGKRLIFLKWHGRGRRFEPVQVHQTICSRTPLGSSSGNHVFLVSSVEAHLVEQRQRRKYNPLMQKLAIFTDQARISSCNESVPDSIFKKPGIEILYGLLGRGPHTVKAYPSTV